MGNKKSKLVKVLILVFLVLFPFGQLLSLRTVFFGTEVNIHPIDIVVGTISLIVITGKLKRTALLNSILTTCLVFAFAYLLSIALFGFPFVLRGGLYLLRLFAYMIFLYAIYLLAADEKDKKLIFSSLIVVSALVAIFGWYQYLFYPDLRSLYFLGWDDHLYRLVGTFLDPGFTSLILVFGFIMSFAQYLKKKVRYYLILAGFFLISIAFTYARAAYLALIGGIIILSKRNISIFKTTSIIIAFLLIIAILPRPEGYGVRLERTHSIFAKLENYSETIKIFKMQPVFGVGFNNICLARAYYLKDTNPDSHACNGSDSSLLFLLATSGLVGTAVFLKFIYSTCKQISKNYYGFVFSALALAVGIHSLFVNSLFYPWVMGYLAILLGISLKRKRLP